MVVRRKTCSLCEAQCGLLIDVEGDQVRSIRGDPDDVLSRGYLCPKAVALQDLHADPDRLRQPMVREGERWREIGWDEAYDQVADRLAAVVAEHGREALGLYLGNPNVHNYAALLAIPTFARALQSKSRFSATSVDQLPHMFAALQMFGHQLALPVPDLERTEHLVILGANPVVSNGSLMTAPDMRRRLKAIGDRGGKVVVLDPRRTETADLADQHAFVRPGTDTVLLLAWLRVMFDEDLVDDGPWRAHARGLERIAEVAQLTTPEEAAPVVGLAVDEIRAMVRAFCAAPSAALYGRVGVCTQRFGGLSAWLVYLVNILSGNLDRAGGLMFPTSPVPFRKLAGRGHFDAWRSRVRGLPEFSAELPVAVLAEEIETQGPGQIRALVTVAGNPVLSTPNGGRLDGALASLDFMVSVEMYINETSRHADIILPPVSAMQRDHFALAFYNMAVHNTVKFDERVFEIEEGSQQDFDILMALSRRLARHVPGRRGLVVRREVALLGWLGPRRVLDLMLRFGAYGTGFNPFGRGLTLERVQANPGGIDLGPLQPALPAVLETRDRKIDLAPAPIIADLGRVRGWLDAQAEATADGMLLIGRRQLRGCNSWMHNVDRLVKGRDRCTLQIHPESAARCGVVDGGRAEVRSRVGSVVVGVEVTDALMPGVVSIPHGWGHGREGTGWRVAAVHPGASINDLTDDQEVDGLTGNAAFSGIEVEVKPSAMSASTAKVA